MKTEPEAAFGTHALPEKREALRASAGRFGDSQLGRWRISHTRKRVLKGLAAPFDVEVMSDVRVRLWPHSSRCEKRVFCGQQIWDPLERAALTSALEQSETAPFVFLDVGANVGLYSLILAARAKQLGKETSIIAVEPDPTNRARLNFNIKASQANIAVVPFAISDTAGTGTIGGGEDNRGEARLIDGDGDSVKVITLHQLCQDHQLSRIDAMKVDIEGYDERALKAFFETAPQALWPGLLILETGREPESTLLSLCTGHGYTVTRRAGINSILTRGQ